ncbi:hypothetical protein CaLGV086 [Clostera anastomosis granulovirus A]|uniref:Uncharacterized protein n=1 Tax=Clostera anastomosis granulovirus A TaxID=1986289 RepID=U5KBV0_9BBAC|nr:hypothetical protein CaLGV086 [Clostera anastomosis granulovirus Henan]AGQ20344.1 hypothetical protein CaLGV086 [Clostera anastomosis granulovirus Henan]
MKRETVYFCDVHPIVVLNVGTNHTYLKLKQLAACLNTNVYRLKQKVGVKHVVTLADLRMTHPRVKSTMHPTTLLVELNRLRALASFRSAGPRCKLLYRFVRSLALEDHESSEDDEPLQYDSVRCVYGVLSNGVEFVEFNNKRYFKGVGVAAFLNCSPSYCINKYVDDVNVVLWGELKRHTNTKYLWLNYINPWKDNTICLKEEGFRQLAMATVGNDDVFRDTMVDVDNYDFLTPITKTKKRRPKPVQVEGCVVGHTDDIEYIVTPECGVYYRLAQVVSKFSLKINEPQKYVEHVIKWVELKKRMGKCEVGWRHNTKFIDGAGVYSMLVDVGLTAEAANFVHYNMFEAKTACR